MFLALASPALVALSPWAVALGWAGLEELSLLLLALAPRVPVAILCSLLARLLLLRPAVLCPLALAPAWARLPALGVPLL